MFLLGDRSGGEIRSSSESLDFQCWRGSQWAHEKVPWSDLD